LTYPLGWGLSCPIVALICHCYGLNDRSIRAAIDAGAVTAEQIGMSCGAGSGCGGCGEVIERMLSLLGESAPVTCEAA
jgi:bacterioferritin-associated ferredoxin